MSEAVARGIAVTRSIGQQDAERSESERKRACGFWHSEGAGIPGGFGQKLLAIGGGVETVEVTDLT